MVSHKAAEDNDEQYDHFDHSKDILQAQTPFQEEAVNQKSSGYTSQPYSSLIPAVDFDLSRIKDVLAKHNAVGSSPPWKPVSNGLGPGVLRKI